MNLDCLLNGNISRTVIIGYLAVFLLQFSIAFQAFDLDLTNEPESTVIPQFNPRPNNVSFLAGCEAILKCSITNLEARYVTWRKMADPNPISIGDYIYSPDLRFTVSIEKDKDEWNLKIKNVSKEDAGVYKCAVSSRIKNLFRLVLLRVKEPPVTIKPAEVTLNGTQFVSRGDPIVLTCNATSNSIAPESLDWFKGGNRVEHSGKNNIIITNTIHHQTLISTLYIKHSTMDDATMFICRNSELDIAHFQVHVLEESQTKNVKRGTLHDGVCSIFSNLQCLILVVLSNFTCYILTCLAMYPT